MKDTYYINLTFEEQRKVIASLIGLKNSLIERGKYSDAVDDAISKIMKAKTRKFKILD